MTTRRAYQARRRRAEPVDIADRIAYIIGALAATAGIIGIILKAIHQ